MGVGLPYGIGAQVAKPDTQVLVLHGDGSMGMNAMEIDTCVRFNLPVVTVISNNAGWTARAPDRRKPGREMGFTNYDGMARELGAYGEKVTDPDEIRPALERAFASGKARCGECHRRADGSRRLACVGRLADGVGFSDKLSAYSRQRSVLGVLTRRTDR